MTHTSVELAYLDELHNNGFPTAEVIPTGGNCTAISIDFGQAGQILVTDGEDALTPESTDACYVSVYDSDRADLGAGAQADLSTVAATVRRLRRESLPGSVLKAHESMTVQGSVNDSNWELTPTDEGFDLRWNDGVANEWSEEFDDLSTALARLAVLMRCGETGWSTGFAQTPKYFADHADAFFKEVTA